jgi:peptidoglycan/xylan/chitin deacetylase (PgdA/CDA1 family)
MSPQTSRYLTPALGDAPEPGGRHRRPESLADLRYARPPANDTPAFCLGSYTDGFIERGFDTPAPAPTPRATRHQRNARPGRHAAARGTTNRTPVIGSHRAPGTLPIESWLLLGKTRQQALLASLVAIGLLLLATPAQQRQDGVDAVQAAAERVAGVSAAKPRPTTDRNAAGGAAEEKTDDKAPAAPTASATAPARVPGVPVTAPAEPDDDEGLGPGRSLRTTGSRAIALTFDDGPDPVQTPRILAMLAANRVRATFCLVGDQVRKHPEIVRQIAADGHALCNHTWNHSLTIGEDKPEQIQADLARTNAAIRAAVPDAEIPFFRAPGGNFTERVVTVAAGDGMTSLYWELDPRDWYHPAGETSAVHVRRLITDVRRGIRPGAIVLSHDFNQPDTIAAYEKLLPWLKERFTIGIPGEPAPEVTTPPASTPPDAPTTPSPTATTTPLP